MNIVEKARIFATAAHAAVKQLRKYTNEPYIIHPSEVASIVKTVDHTPEMLAAAWLHDVVEDTGVPLSVIWVEFGEVVGEYVEWLTDDPEATGNREQRKAASCARLAQAPGEAQTVKLADLISNTSSIVKYDPKFAVTYLKEKRALLDVLTKADPSLRARAYSVLENAEKDIG